MTMPSSQNIRSESKMVPNLRPVMPVDLFKAVMEGDRDLLIRRLGLEPEEQTECKVTIEGASHAAPEEINTENQTVQSELQSATEETIRHLLVTKGHNGPNLEVFHRYVSLFKAQNNMLETPVHCAAKVTMEGVSHFAPEEINTENQTVQSELQSATRFGDTILHLLVTEGHNELALKVFQKDMSLFKAQNNMLETPLHRAAKVGNHMFLYNLIQSDCVVEKDALAQTNTNGETALHLAAKNGHTIIGYMIMNLDPEMAFKVNNKLLSPLHLAIVNEHTEMVQIMLGVDPTLACTPFSDEMFPVHEAARTGNEDLVKHFMIYFPKDAELRDPRGRNIFHIAAEEKKDFFLSLFNAAVEKKRKFSSSSDGYWEKQKKKMDADVEKIKKKLSLFKVGEEVKKKIPSLFNAAEEKKDLFPSSFKSHVSEEMIKRMIIATDYEGNTAFHIASIVGDKNNMRAIWEHIKGAEAVRNNQGLTPFQLSVRQLLKTREDIDHEGIIHNYLENDGHKFTETWFRDVMEPSKYRGDKAQIVGLGSVLITTVTFAAAFTIPGGYNQDHGTPLLGRRYIFKAFVLANALAFIQGFISLFVLISRDMAYLCSITLLIARVTFVSAATSMVIAFGLGMYVTLAPVCYPIASLILGLSVFFGSPFGFGLIFLGEQLFRSKEVFIYIFLPGLFVIPFLFVFCLALL